MNFEDIHLEESQRELLDICVEASRNVDASQKQKFVVIKTNQQDLLYHPGLKGKRLIYHGDVETLANLGFLFLSYTPKGTPNFDVIPEGYKYY
jgi:hypothetical protein